MNHKPWHILLVDDDEADRTELRQTLMRGSERRILFTETDLGAVAVKKSRDMPAGYFDCIILDYYLPDMNGDEVLLELCNGKDLPPCPVVVVTGAIRKDGASLLRAGAQDYISKNRITPESLMRAVENSIERFALLQDRLKALQALRISEQRLAMGVQIAGLGLGDVDYTTDIVRLSSEAATMFGFGNVSMNVARAALHARFHPDDRADVMQAITQSLNPKGTGSFELDYRVVWPDGQVRWLRLRNHIIFTDGDGGRQPLSSSFVALDVTVEKYAEHALRDSEEKFRALLEASPDAIVIVDKYGLIVLVNALTISLFGYSRSELLGQKVEMLMPPRFRHGHVGLRENYVSNASPREMNGGLNLLGRRKDGSEFPIEVSLSPLETKQGRLVSSAIRDITERKITENELNKAKAAAENANRAKSDFLSSMSHELRSPLNAILGFAQLLESATPPLTARQKSGVDQILHAGWYLLELINEILDLALIESGKLSLSLEAIDLHEVVTDCQAMIEPHAQNSGIQLFFPEFTDRHLVKADRTRVKQVFLNLLSNAIKYNRIGGRVEVKFSYPNTDTIRISVHDTGEGLAPEKLAELFQPFNRLGKESGSEEGTGIGLVVSKRLVELMGGTIGVDSTLGEGSEFWFELLGYILPPATTSFLPTPSCSETKTNGEMFTLLYVEDNPANLMLVEQLIESYPHINLLSAKSGKQGVNIARLELPDMILMDINLPGISGIEALTILREDELTADIPVIALSANAMPTDIEKGLQAGFFRYLTKPIKINEFMNVLADVLALTKTNAIHANETGH